MSKLEKQLTRRLKVFLYRKEETRKVFLHSVWKEFHIQTQSQETHEDPHWRETVHM